MTALSLSIALAILATIAHEIGHLLGAVLVGAQIRGVGLSWVGFSCSVSIWPPCRWRAIACLLSGSAVNFLLTSSYLCGGEDWALFGLVNALMGGLNLLLPRSDGWQAWRIAFGRRA